jgi:hypothetical protein
VEFLIVLAILAIVVVVVSAPLRRTRVGQGACAAASESSQATVDGGLDLANLEAARTAKYREIRDAELDHRTGKLSDADFEALNAALRVEAVEILRALDRAQGRQAS